MLLLETKDGGASSQRRDVRRVEIRDANDTTILRVEDLGEHIRVIFGDRLFDLSLQDGSEQSFMQIPDGERAAYKSLVDEGFTALRLKLPDLLEFASLELLDAVRPAPACRCLVARITSSHLYDPPFDGFPLRSLRDSVERIVDEPALLTPPMRLCVHLRSFAAHLRQTLDDPDDRVG